MVPGPCFNPHTHYSVKDVLSELQLERDTWQLIRGLYSDRLSSEEEEEEDMTEREVWGFTCKR